MLSQNERIAIARCLEIKARSKRLDGTDTVVSDVIAAAIAWSRVDPEFFRPEILAGRFGVFDCDTFAE